MFLGLSTNLRTLININVCDQGVSTFFVDLCTQCIEIFVVEHFCFCLLFYKHFFINLLDAVPYISTPYCIWEYMYAESNSFSIILKAFNMCVSDYDIFSRGGPI